MAQFLSKSHDRVTSNGVNRSDKSDFRNKYRGDFMKDLDCFS